MEHPNHRMIIRVLDALGALASEVVLVGGVVVDLYCDAPLLHFEVRPTKDVDIVTNAITFGELNSFSNELYRNGFYQSIEDDVICRFRWEDVIVDVMSTVSVGWAPSNRWLALGYFNSIECEIDARKFRILDMPYFLATKFAAFRDRGSSDPRMSHDLEDIVTVLDGRKEWPQSILAADSEVRDYLAGEIGTFLIDQRLQEAIIGNLPYHDQTLRFRTIMEGARTLNPA
jgi:hypothetical protein